MGQNSLILFHGMKVALICLLLTFALNKHLLAATETGMDLRDACRATHLDMNVDSATKLQVMKMVRCVAYVDGVTDGWVQAGGHLCAPASATLEQYADVVSKYLEDHPERLHLQAGMLVIEALNRAWPCK
jgi:hypothetical protein